jgi:hypothetical protein
MDLTNIWQEHRTFILLVMAGLLVFFVGQGVISSVYGIDETKRTVDRHFRNLQRAEYPSTSQLDEARDLNEALTEEYEASLKKINFVPDPKYLLSKDEKPDIQYDRLFNEARDTLVEGAKTLNITVDENLGMPELSPTRPAEIQRALIALDIVTRVVLLAVESQIGVIDTIDMVPETGRRKQSFMREQRVKFKMQGKASAMAEFLRRFTLQDNFLGIEEAEFDMADSDGNQIKAAFTVSALTIIKEDSDT